MENWANKSEEEKQIKKENVKNSRLGITFKIKKIECDLCKKLISSNNIKRHIQIKHKGNINGYSTMD